jgi:hypothetical protein
MNSLPLEEKQLEKLLTVVSEEEKGGAATPDQLLWSGASPA